MEHYNPERQKALYQALLDTAVEPIRGSAQNVRLAGVGYAKHEVEPARFALVMQRALRKVSEMEYQAAEPFPHQLRLPNFEAPLNSGMVEREKDWERRIPPTY